MNNFYENDNKEMKMTALDGNKVLTQGRNFNEVLKERENREKAEKENIEKQTEMSLDSTERIKVLSPGQLVFKRFITNKLAIVGSVILLSMFVFAFIVPIFYPYSQTQIFYKYDNSVVDYAQAKVRTDYSIMLTDDTADIHYSVKNKLTTAINSMEAAGIKEQTLADSDGNTYRLENKADHIYALYSMELEEFARESGTVKYATYAVVGKKLELEPGMEEMDGFADAINKAVLGKAESFELGGETFTLEKIKKTYNVYMSSEGFSYASGKPDAEFEALVEGLTESQNIEYKGDKYSVVLGKDGSIVAYRIGGEKQVAYLTTYVFDAFDSSFKITDEFTLKAIESVAGDKKFEVSGVSYEVKAEGEEELVFATADETNPVAAFSTMVIRRYNGEDSLEFAFKEKTRETIEEMLAGGTKTATFTWPIAQVDAAGEYSYDESGNIIKEDRTVTINDKNGSYVLSAEQVVYLIDTFARPTKEHWAGTDGDGMDVLARMMYGGRVSLIFSFVVIIIETFLGIVMGGISGYFGGWVDTLIMRLVDIFYCIPSMPILIILGSMFDALKLKPYVRVGWLMIVLGVLGWAGVARMVRGQILSLREQEFMVATEAVGIKTKRRIFKHLIPNVMPQLIVTATSGLGDVIITESTLSFLGLGVKHPLATWGTMINSVSTAEAMKTYTYIWVPVGLLICLTVVAFNFVGDGLRDAFDPKMKR